ncbi:MAG: hypothetical protein OEW67_13155 [Cyclobacteriaceae bacterium]|nr:hypothetical protein [Cyclobacteriaceae bacterium]
MQKRFVLILILWSTTWIVIAQDTIRVEIDQKYNDPQPEVVSAGVFGVVLLEHKRDMSPGIMNLIHYDTVLEKRWEQEFPFTKKLDLVDHIVERDKLYMVFNDEYEETLEVAVADLSVKQVNVFHFPYFNRFDIKEMCVKNGEVYIAGMLRKLPAAIRLNLKELLLTSLPMAINGDRIEIEDMFVAKNERVSVTIAFQQRRNKEVLIKEFDEDNISDDLLITPTEEYDLVNGKVSHLGSKSKIVIGTYGYRNSDATQGFYIAGFYQNQEVFKKYHHFNDLDNFYSFKSDREQERIEEIIEKKKSQGREYKSKYRIMTHEVISQGGNYLMLGEAYYPTYRQQRVRRYSPRGYYYETKIVFDGYKYTHAVVVAFNKKGDIIWDYSFKINDIKSMELKEHVRVNSTNEITKLVYNLEGKMNIMTIRNGKMESKDENIALPSKYENDQVKYSDLGQSEHWYGNHYLAWGYQRIRNIEGKGSNKKRNVFYINKLTF